MNPLRPQTDLRIIILGRSGVGKTGIANAILGRNAFRETETTQCNLQSQSLVDQLLVVDTPGINSRFMTPGEIENLRRLSSPPSPCVFLLLIRMWSFTDEERISMDWIRKHFGAEALRFTMILFIGREHLTERAKMAFLQNDETMNFLSQCSGRYVVINSRRDFNRNQIRNLLREIKDIVPRTGREHFNWQGWDQRRVREAQTESIFIAAGCIALGAVILLYLYWL